ncbi:MAG: ParA family protein [Planctomycetota bacterium]
MTRTIAVANQKGGVGKTTTAVNLAAFLQRAGRTVLLMDLDPQANATSGVGSQVPSISPIQTALEKPRQLPSLLEPTYARNLYLLPGSAMLGQQINEGHYQGIRDLRAQFTEANPPLDYVIIDCPPAMSTLSLLALQLADSVVIPVQSEYYAMEGLSQIVPLIEGIQRGDQEKLEIEGLLVTMYCEELDLSQEVYAEVCKFFPNKVFQTVIPRDVALAEASSHGRPIVDYDLRSRGSWAYLNLAKEILSNERLEETR